MKKSLILFVLAFVNTIFSSFAANVTAYLTYANFNLPGQQPYFETHLSVIGNSLQFVKNANGKFQASVDIAVSLLQDGVIKAAQKYTLNSPEVDDTTKALPNFLDQQRYSLPNGEYVLQLSIADKNKVSENPFISKIPVKIDFPDDRITVSDVELLESYTKATATGPLTKSGYDLVPYVSSFYPENSDKLKFYAEIYNAKKILGEGEKMIVSYYIESYEKKVKLSDYSAFSKQTASDVNILLSEFSIKDLPSGNYNFRVEIRDKENKIQAEQYCFFQRKNKLAETSLTDLASIDVTNTFVVKYKSADTLLEYMRCLRPISSKSEITYTENQIAAKNLPQMQQFFFNFWKTRNELNPEQAWNDYYLEVRKVNQEFGTYGLKGYDTDRGRVYLQYGPPDTRDVAEMEPSAYPYEIWQYNTLVDKSLLTTNPYNKQANKKFVFYNPDLVSNKYLLLHSDAKGELYNSRWQIDIHKRDTQSHNLDDTTVPEHYGGQSDSNFNNPK